MIPIPIGDAPNFRSHRPWVTWGLIAVNVAVFVWARSTNPSAVDYQTFVIDWGFIPLAPRLETWITSMFMHAGWGHLLGNMLFLWIFGDNVEGRLGHFGYLCMYLAAGLAAVLAFRVLAPEGSIPLVGASGAIFGVLGFYFWAFPRNRVRFFLWFFFVFAFWMPARIVLALYLGLDLVRLILQRAQPGAGGGDVAYAAHVGGFAFGLLLALVLARAMPPLMPARTRPTRHHGAAPVLFQNALFFLRRGRLHSARATFEAVLREHPESPEASWSAFQLGHMLEGVFHDPRSAAEHFEYAARHHPDRNVRAEAVRLAARARALAS